MARFHRVLRPLEMLALAGGTALLLSLAALAGPGLAQGDELGIAAKDFWFEPTYPTVPVGTTVTWTNGDDESHTVTSDLRLFDQEIWPGETWGYTFTEAGVYFYYCLPHDWMIGEITVVAGGGG